MGRGYFFPKSAAAREHLYVPAAQTNEASTPECGLALPPESLAMTFRIKASSPNIQGNMPLPVPTHLSVEDPMEVLVSMWSASTEWWRSHLGPVTPEAVQWQPFARSHSISGMLIHIAERESYWMEEVLEGRMRSPEELALLQAEQTRPNEKQWSEPYEWDLQEHFEVLDWIRNRSLRSLRAHGDPAASVLGPNGEPITLRCVVTHLMAHENYHAGQMMLHKLHYSFGGVEPD